MSSQPCNTAADGQKIESLKPSKLGTKSYWDHFYSVERVNFQENSNDTGECWFADSGAEEKVVDFLVQVAEDEELPDIVDICSSKILDLGTGNGRLLFSVREAGFESQLTGIDYSEQAVEFSRKIAEAEEIEDVDFIQANFLVNDDWNTDGRTWDVVLDKGTLDAIALSGNMYGDNEDGTVTCTCAEDDADDEDNNKNESTSRRTAVEQYALRVPRLVRKGGMVLITSCNFTEPELIRVMTSTGHLSAWKSIEYPTFQFGGVQGQTVCSIAFLRI